MSISVVKSEPNTYVISGDMTDSDVKYINGLSKGSIVRMKFTNQATPERLSQITSNVKISVYGSVNYVDKAKYKRPDIQNYRTDYTPRELAVITNKIKKMTDRVDSSWTDLEKAMYCAIALAREMEYEHKKGNWDKIQPNTGETINIAQCLRCIDNGKGVCAGYAMVYQEMLNNIGMKCEYQEKIGDHAWNVITIKKGGRQVRIPIDITWLSEAIRNDSLTFNSFIKLFGGIKPVDFYNNPHHDVKTDPEENTDFSTMAYFDLTDPATLAELKNAYNKAHQALNKREFKLIPHTNPSAQMLIADYPEIATGGAYKAYMVAYNGPDKLDSSRKKLLTKGDLVLIYAPSDIDIRTYAPDKIVEAMLDPRLKGFVGADTHKNLYNDYISRAEPQSMTFRRTHNGSVAIFENEGSVVNGVNAFSALHVDSSAPGGPMLVSNKIYSELHLTETSEGDRKLVGDNLLSDAHIAASAAKGNYVGAYSIINGPTPIYNPISDPNLEKKIKDREIVP